MIIFIYFMIIKGIDGVRFIPYNKIEKEAGEEE